MSKKLDKVEKVQVQPQKYVKPTMHSEKVFRVGFEVEPFNLCGSTTLWNAALCLS
jgi:hypothetical protein